MQCCASTTWLLLLIISHPSANVIAAAKGKFRATRGVHSTQLTHEIFPAVSTGLTTSLNGSASSWHPAPATSPSTLASTAVAPYILQGLGVQVSSGISTNTATSPNKSSATDQPSSSRSLWVGVTVSQFSVDVGAITAKANQSSDVPQLSAALQCYSQLATWRNERASFVNSNIANRTWSVTSIWSSTADAYSSSTTIYPSDFSTYKLCDGSPRADVRPETTHWSANTTLWGSFTSTLTPTFRPQPCTPSPVDCRLLYHDTNAETVDEDMLLDFCGNPAHIGDSYKCLIAGGPVGLIYFPVKSSNDSLCASNASPRVYQPQFPSLSEITTLGQIFTSGSVYLSFKTLFATWDGFSDTIGPTFSDFIVTLQSTEISTQCINAFGPGTPLNYADLNWPVPASAYQCQHRCSVSQSSSAYLEQSYVSWDWTTVPPGPECKTIWSDVNPLLAVPTRVRDMVPQWKSCSFWDINFPNLWFDPPVALKPASVAGSLTSPLQSPTTPAAPSSTALNPVATITSAIATDASSSSSSAVGPEQSSSPLNQPAAEGPSRGSSNIPASSAELVGPVLVKPTPSLQISLSESVPDNAPGATASSAVVDLSTSERSNSVLGSVLPAFSVLTQALASSLSQSSPEHVSNGLTSGGQSIVEDPASTSSPAVESGEFGPMFSFDPIASASSALLSASSLSNRPEAFPLGSLTLLQGGPAVTLIESTPAQVSTGLTLPTVTNNFILTASHIVLAGDSLTIPISFVPEQSGVLAVGGKTIYPGGPATTVEGIEISNAATEIIASVVATPSASSVTASSLSRSDNIGPSVMTAQDVTITASAMPASKSILVDGNVLSEGGPAMTTDSATISYGSKGLLLLGPTTAASFEVVNPTATSEIVYIANDLRITASKVFGPLSVYVIDGTTISQSGDAATFSSMTFTDGPSGLEIVQSNMTKQMSTAALTDPLPSLVWASSSSSSATASAHTAKPSHSIAKAVSFQKRWLAMPACLAALYSVL